MINYGSDAFVGAQDSTPPAEYKGSWGTGDPVPMIDYGPDAFAAAQGSAPPPTEGKGGWGISTPTTLVTSKGPGNRLISGRLLAIGLVGMAMLPF